MALRDYKPLFQLNPEVTFLNFGSFGACPRSIFDRYQTYQKELEYEPVQFILNKGIKYLEQSRIALGQYIGCSEKDIVYVPNPSYAVNLVMRAVDLQPGDEILTTDLEYGACEKTLDYICKKAEATLVKVPTILPISSKEEFVNQFVSYFSDRTKMVFISQITSSTAIRLPVEEIVKKAKELGILTFVDGAHACGQIPLNLQELDADLYTAACHKWMMTPKGSSFLYARKSVQSWLDPLIVSWGYNALFPSDSQFLDYHQFNGTRDFTGYLCIPEAIKFMKEYNWWEVAANCQKLIKDNMLDYYQLLGSTPHAPLDDFFILQMLAAEIITDQPEKLYRKIYDEYKIEVPVMRHGDKVFLRFSINAFNDQSDIDKLFDMIKKEGIRGK
jgi:isopenicillin-N epimerase